jgi:hypothetical protein
VTLVGIAIIAFAYVKKRSRGSSRENTVRKEEEFRDLNDVFFEKLDRESVIPLVRVYAPKDKMFIRSLLDSEGIPTYVGNEHINNMFPGVRMQGNTDTIIHIMANDRERAVAVVEDYIRNLIESINPDIDSKVDDFLGLINALPTSFNQILPEIIEE